MDKSPDATVIANVIGNILDVNPMATSLIGYSKQELIGINFKKLHPPLQMGIRP